MNIQVEDEDSLTERFERPQEVGQIDMAVIRVPRFQTLQILIRWKVFREYHFGMCSTHQI